MYDLIPILSTVLPIIASSLLIAVLSINLYLKIRRRFPISVNCWFCNSWTKVSYDDRNSFHCPTCSQYNGFTKDGDYNKVIPEQRDELMNRSTRRKSHKSTVSNGLCALCNNNQQLKIFQLAHFVPLNEENYDVEIEHFQKQLEKAYKLCKKCDVVLKKALQKQNAWIFGNRIKSMCSNGISKVANQIRKETKLSIFTKLGAVFSLTLTMAVIFSIIFGNKFISKKVSSYVPLVYLPIYKSVVSLVNTSKIVEFNYFAPYFSKSVRLEPQLIICGIGLTLQLLKTIRDVTATKVNQFLCWTILFLISWVRFNRNYSNYILIVETFSCIYLICTTFSTEETRLAQKPKGKSMRKLVKNLEYTCSDFSDTSDFENISSSSKHCTSRDSSDYLSSTVDVPQPTTATNILNSSFVSAKSTLDPELNKSLNNLSLGFKSPRNAYSVASFAVKRPRPVLSPPKLQTVNSWVAGGFWKDGEGVFVPTVQRTNLSRSSSESSGFGSQHNEFLPPKSNYYGDFERLSMNSDFSRLSPCYYPNNMLMVQRVGSPGLIRFNEGGQRKGLFENWSDRINSQATQSFRDLRLGSNN